MIMEYEEDIFSNTSIASNVDEIDASLWNLTLQEIHEEESKSLENIKMKHICGPSIRSKLKNLTVNLNQHLPNQNIRLLGFKIRGELQRK